MDSVESKIGIICQSKNVSPDELELHLDKFSENEENYLLELLKESVNLQEVIYVRLGGNLDNVIFLDFSK